MVTYLLNFVYLLLLVAATPWLLWQSARTGKYREGWGAKLWGAVPSPPENGQPRIWWHAVSVGEVNLLRTLIAEVDRRGTPYQHCISTTTQTGYALARQRFPQATVFYCPLDFSWAVQRALRRMRPQRLILVELELWPNLIRLAQQAGVPVAIVNGRLSDSSFRGYLRLRPLVGWLLRHIDLIAAQNEQYAERFRALGASAHQVHITGSIKYDGAQANRANPATLQLKQLAGITENDIVFLAGSTQAGEEQAALETYLHLAATYPRLRLILVPRHPERFSEVAALLDRSGLPWQRRSELAPHAPAPASDRRVLLVDAVGELGAWWGTAEIAFVGGSLGSRGGQNMIEPAAYGAAVSFGPNTKNFRDIVASLLAAEAAVVVQNPADLTRFVERCLTDPAWAQALGHRAARLVASGQGATRETIDLLAIPLVASHTSNNTPARHAA